jgi:hydroxyethylthiazole kinase
VTISPGATLRVLRERKPLVHQITNYVVMNETANATLALGALPVMAHAREEVEEMVGLAGALVLNIGTLSPHWVEAMLAAGRAANARGTPVVLDPVGAGATTYRTETAKRILDEVDVTVLRGNAGEVATLVGLDAEVRGVESIATGSDPAELARAAARALGVVASVTGPVDHVSDGEAVLAVANGHELLGTVTGTGCMSSAITGCFLAAKPDAPLAAAAEALAAFGVAGEDAARDAKGPGSFHVNVYDALAGLDPDSLDRRALVTEIRAGLDVAFPRNQDA